MLKNHTTDGEEIILSCHVDSVKEITGSNEKQIRNINSECVFGATNRRLMYLENGNSIKEIDYSNIQPFSSDNNKKSRSSLQKMLLSYGSILTILGLFVIFNGNREFGLIGFLVGIASIGVGALMEFGLINLLTDISIDEGGEKIYVKSTNAVDEYLINISSNDDQDQKLEIITDEDIETRLNKIIQDQTGSY